MAHGSTQQAGYENWRSASLGLLAFLTLLPVTLPVPVLRDLVQTRFDVSEFLASLFMSINMVGAVVAGPLAGAFADRTGRRKALIAPALLLDGALLYGLSLPVSFEVFMGLRFLEGCTHITALSLLLSIASHSQPEAKRGRAMGIVGAGLTLGVAVGAPIGGFLGQEDPLVPLRAGSAVVVVAAILAQSVLRDVGGANRRAGLGFIVQAIKHNRLIAAPLAFAFADRFTVGFFTTTFSLYLSRVHGFEPAQIGVSIAALMLPFALLSYPFGRLAERTSRAAMMCGGSLVYGLGVMSLAWWPPDAIPFGMAGLGVAAALMFVPSLVMTTDCAPEEIRTTALGAFNAAGSLGFIVGPITGGLVSQMVAARSDWESGYRAAFTVAGFSELLCVAIALPFLLRLVRSGRTT